MKSAVFYGKNDLRIEEKHLREIGKNDVLVRVHACGICGTDVHIFHGDEGAAPTPAGTVLGHEFAGEVEKIGSDVKDVAVGDKVCVDPNKLCGSCDYCRRGIGHFCTSITGIGTTVDGGFSEYCAVPASQIYKVREHLSYAEAAMAEPVSCCLHGIELCHIQCGDTVAVIGCGMIGLIMLQLSKLSGAATVIAIEPIAEKREQALNLGADYAFDPRSGDIKTMLAENGITQIDAVIECVGKPETIEQAVTIAGKYSVVMMFGLTRPDAAIRVKPFEIFKKEITLRSSYINPYTFPAAVKLIENKKIDVHSMIYKEASLRELPDILRDPKKYGAGKHIIIL